MIVSRQKKKKKKTLLKEIFNCEVFLILLLIISIKTAAIIKQKLKNFNGNTTLENNTMKVLM
jgi:hypothetical protein